MSYLKVSKPSYRAWLQSMTKEEIQKEFLNLKSSESYRGLANAALARSIADWKIGMNGTRAITAWSSKIYNVGFNKQVVGRVKTPTLAMIVNRDKEIDLFTPEKYFQIKATFRINSGEYVGSYIDQNFNNSTLDPETKRVRKADRVFSEENALKIINDCRNKEGIVKEESKERKEYSEALFDLTS